MTRPPSEPIDVVGVGLVGALGADAATCWRRLRDGRTGLRREAGRLDGGWAPGFADLDDEDPRRRAEVLALAAAREALCQAGSSSVRADRTALVVGSSMAALASSRDFWPAFLTDPRSADYRALGSYEVEPTLVRLAAAVGAEGGAWLVSNACAAGASALAIAADRIRLGQADRAVVLGFDALDLHTHAGFEALTALTDRPPTPFATGRSGMQLGDGFAALVLERTPAAAARPLARLVGVGESNDAHHLTQPDPGGHGAARAMDRALADAGLGADAIDYVNVHATATPANDAAEARALVRVFGERLPSIPLGAFKPALGHTLGGAGAVEAVLTVLVLVDQELPPSLGGGPLDPEVGDLDLVPVGRPAHVRRAMSNAFGFGGSNASLVLEAVR